MGADQRYLCPPAHSGLSYCYAHFPAGMVGYEPHRVDSLAGSAGGHKDLFAGKILLKGDLLQHIFHENALLRQTAVADIAVGKHPPVGGDDLVAVGGQLTDIVLNYGIVEHIVVHGGSHQLFAGAGHDRGGEHIVSDAVCELSDDVCRGGCDKHTVGGLCKGNVFHAVLEVPVKGVDKTLVVREGLKSYGVDELCGVARHQNMDIRPQLYEHSCSVCHFIGGDRACYRDNYCFTFEHC